MKKITAFIFVIILISANFVFAQKPQIKFKPYGFFKFDMAYDQARTNNGNYVFWVNYSNPDQDKDSEISITARQTRLGFRMNVENLEEVKVTTRFEADFYNASAENKNALMLRYAYLKVEKKNFYILAGQTADVISPLVPTTVNYTVLWNCGNIGYRRPQFQAGVKGSNGVELVGALARNIPGDLDGDGQDDGEDKSLPMTQFRLSYTKDKVNIGVSGHYGLGEYYNAGTNEDDSYATYSMNVHFSFALSPKFTLKGEGFTGRNMSQFLGGIGQSFSPNKDMDTDTKGGWVCASIKASDKTSLNAGFGIDKPDTDEGIGFPVRRSNRCVFGNLFTKIAYNTRLGLELSHWSTGYYAGSEDEDVSNLRAHASFIFNF